MHLKKMEWFNKLEQGDKSHKAMMAKNKYKVNYILSNVKGFISKCPIQRYTKYTSGHMRDQLMRVHEAYQAIR